MKSTKNCTETKSAKGKNSKSVKTSTPAKKNCKNCKNTSESDSDPDGSYTGNPIGWGKYSLPVQDVDDL